MATSTIFTKDDLEHFLQRRHDEAPADGIPDDPSSGIAEGTYDVTHRLVSAWLKEATGLKDLPENDDLVWAWAVELAALAVENPASTSAMTTDRITKTWSAADARRRDQILAKARAWALSPDVAPLVAAPLGSFPEAAPLPAELYPRPPRSRSTW